MLYCCFSKGNLLPLHLSNNKDDKAMKSKIILGIFMLLALCGRADVDGSLTIPNWYGDKALLPDFRDYKDESDSITIEKVFFRMENNNSLFLIGNIAGGKSSLVVALDKKKSEILYCAESARIDTVKSSQLGNRQFLCVEQSYSDMCTKDVWYSIYVIEKGTFFRCFSDVKEVECLSSESYCSNECTSYNKNFDFEVKDDVLIITIQQQIEGGSITDSRKIINLREMSDRCCEDKASHMGIKYDKGHRYIEAVVHNIEDSLNYSIVYRDGLAYAEIENGDTIVLSENLLSEKLNVDLQSQSNSFQKHGFRVNEPDVIAMDVEAISALLACMESGEIKVKEENREGKRIVTFQGPFRLILHRTSLTDMEYAIIEIENGELVDATFSYSEHGSIGLSAFTIKKHYDYDKEGRIVRVLHDGKIVKEITYHDVCVE
jgi:hypothetical protein